MIHGVASGAAGWAPEIVEEMAKEYDVYCMSLYGNYICDDILFRSLFMPFAARYS